MAAPPVRQLRNLQSVSIGITAVLGIEFCQDVLKKQGSKMKRLNKTERHFSLLVWTLMFHLVAYRYHGAPVK